MMGYFNGKERTITQFRDLLKEGGWELVAIHHDTPSALDFGKIIAVPG